MSEYLLGNSDREHERLIRQAVRLVPITEAFFREAGIGPGQRVLDLGSGVGDVAMLAARLVGPSGEVVAVERDARSINRAKSRCTDAGFRNVQFRECDIAQIPSDGQFDAVVGRYILQFIPDPVSVLRSVSRLVRPDGVVAFQEGSWAPFIQLSAHLPLWSASVALLYDAARRFGVHTELGPALHKSFLDAGLPAPSMRLEMMLGNDPDFTRLAYDAICSQLPHLEKLEIRLDSLGDLATLRERLQEEVAASNTVVPWIALVGAWCRTPAHSSVDQK
jgi:SAM-dependent methyltransferase